MNNQYIKQLFDTNHQIIMQSKPEIDGLFAGKLGLSYYQALIHQISGDEESKDISVELLEEVLEDFYASKSTLLQATYTGGAAGLGYTICYLNKVLSLELDIESDLSDLDEYLFDSAVELIGKNDIDCLHGAGGILFYFAERGNVEYLNKLVPIIISKAIQSNDGVWFQNNFLGPAQDGFANFSISHGMAGLLIILLKTTPYLNNENIENLKKVVSESIRFINTYYLPLDADSERDSFYPPSVDVIKNEYSHKCRVAWCYGDLGIVLLLYKTGKFLGDQELINRATEIGIQTLSRKSHKETGISDPFFCHGSAGLSSFYYKLYLESGDKRYIDGMDFWMNETVNFLSKDNASFIHNPHEVLDGLIGVNIAILEYLNKDTSVSLSNIFFL